MPPPTVAPKVFAHYFTPYLISLDNGTARVAPATSGGDYYDRNFLDPGGESGAHAAYGGLLRDRPIPRAPLSGDYQAQDMQTEVRQAMTGGLDGFTLDLLGGVSASSTSYNLTRQKLLMQAAADVSSSFKIMLMPDMNNWTTNGSTDSTKVITNAVAAARIKTLAAYSSAFRLPDSRLVIAPFHAELWTPARWQTALDAIEAQVGPVAFVPCFLNYDSNIAAFTTISQLYGASTWGNRTAATQPSDVPRATDAHSRNLIWMQAVSTQDTRPNQSKYWEANNTENLLASWKAARDGDADWVQIPTWNDYSENAHIAPSAKHGWTFLNLSKHFLTWWKTGTEPSATQDELYLTHRPHPSGATPSGGQTKLMVRQTSTVARDLIEAVTILASPATVTIKVNGTTVATASQPAGVAALTAPFSVGTVSAQIVRSGTTALSVTSPVKTVSVPVVQDLNYVGATALGVAPVAPLATVAFGVHDAAKPVGMLDTLEGAYSGGSGTGIGLRIPAVPRIQAWTAITSGTVSAQSLNTGNRDLALHQAGHRLFLTFRAPSTYAQITNGTDDAAIDAFGDRLYALPWGAAVSGSQAGAAYGGTTATKIRLSLEPQMDVTTTKGNADAFKAAWRYFFARVKARRPSGAAERVVAVPIFTVTGATNGQALLFLPGLTSTDHVDAIGINGFVPAGQTTLFQAYFSAWPGWVDTNAPGRKLAVLQTAIHPVTGSPTLQADFMADMVAALTATNPRYDFAAWWAPDTWTTTPDDRDIDKAANPTGWEGFHDAVAAVYQTGLPAADTTAPAVPTGLSVSAVTSTTVTLAWNRPAASDTAGYRIRLGDGTVLSDITGAGTLTLTRTGLTPASTEKYQIAAFDTTGNVSAYSTAITSTTLASTAPVPPAITSASVIVNGSSVTATAAGTDPAGGVVTFVWTWGDGTSDSGSSATHRLPPGSWNVRLDAISSETGLSIPRDFPVVTTLSVDDTTGPPLNLVQPPATVPIGYQGPADRENLQQINDAIAALQARLDALGG